MSEPDREAPRHANPATAAREVVALARNLLQLEVELAGIELRRKAKFAGIGIGLALLAAVLAFFGLAFALATIAAAIALELSWWLSLLIVTAFLLGLAAAAGLIGVTQLKKGVPPAPTRAIDEAKRTMEAIRR